jgi:hypothetical protein
MELLPYDTTGPEFQWLFATRPKGAALARSLQRRAALERARKGAHAGRAGGVVARTLRAISASRSRMALARVALRYDATAVEGGERGEAGALAGHVHKSPVVHAEAGFA